MVYHGVPVDLKKKHLPTEVRKLVNSLNYIFFFIFFKYMYIYIIFNATSLVRSFMTCTGCLQRDRFRRRCGPA